jgi:hypothetical protein
MGTLSRSAKAIHEIEGQLLRLSLTFPPDADYPRFANTS